MSVHGIRTHAEWQNTLAEILNAEGILFKNRRFGYYPITSFVRPARNQAEVDEFFGWYGDVVERHPNVDLDDPTKRPSVIAHSFGTFIIGYAMLKYREIRFDKVILCGSILPRDFDWHELFVREQVGRVRNECGGQDAWVMLAPLLVRGTGRSGRKGFLSLGTRCSNEPHKYHKHSDFFQAPHISGTWLPFLCTPPTGFEVVNGSTIQAEKTYARYIHRTRAIDRVRFGALPAHQAVAIPFGYSRQWRQVNPHIYTFLIDRTSGKPCGYINAMPLEDDAYAKITTGKMLDPEIPADAIVPYVADQSVKLYVLSIAVAPGVERAGDGLMDEPLELLLDAFFGQLRSYASQGIRITEVAAIGWTAKGRRICERLFGMKMTGDLEFKEFDAQGKESIVKHPVYKLDLTASIPSKPARMHRGLRKLIETYAEL